MPLYTYIMNEFKNISTKKIWLIIGIITLTIVVLLLFKILFNLLLLTLAAVLMATYFLGCANLLHRKLKLSKGLSLAIAIIVNIILIGSFFWLVGARLEQQFSSLTGTMPQTIEHAKSQLQKNPVGSKFLNYLNNSGNSQKTVSAVKKFFSSAFGILSDVYIILLLGIFFTASPSTYKKGIVLLLPVKAKEKGDQLLNEIYGLLKNWIKGQLFGFLFIAVLTGLGLWILGMPMVLTLAIIAGLLNFIPNFGPVIALVPAVLIAFTQGSTNALWVIGLYTLIQVIQSAVTQPLIQKKMVRIPPALIIFGQVAMGLLGGFWGVLLATPVVAIIMTIIKKLYVEEQSKHKYEMQKS